MGWLVGAGSRTLNGLGPNDPGCEALGDVSSDRSSGPIATSRPVDSSASVIESALTDTLPRSSGAGSPDDERSRGRLVVPFA